MTRPHVSAHTRKTILDCMDRANSAISDRWTCVITPDRHGIRVLVRYNGEKGVVMSHTRIYSWTLWDSLAEGSRRRHLDKEVIRAWDAVEREIKKYDKTI